MAQRILCVCVEWFELLLIISDACSVQLDRYPSRCPILCQQPVQMSQLMSGDPVKPVCVRGVNFELLLSILSVMHAVCS